MIDVLSTKAQAEFGVTLPRDYVTFMRNYPKVLEETKVDFGRVQEPISKRYFLQDVEAILAINRDIRKALPIDGEVIWTYRFFIIGETDGGDCYAMDCDAEGSAVFCWNHEEHIFEPLSESVVAFADFIVNDVRKWNEE
jgi:hypothetical protein